MSRTEYDPTPHALAAFVKKVNRADDKGGEPR